MKLYFLNRRFILFNHDLFLGHAVNDGENKVMSMSTYGNDTLKDTMNKVIYLDDKEIFNQNMEYFEYHFSLYNNFSKKLNNLFGDPTILILLF